MKQIFDPKKILAHRNKAVATAPNSEFFKYGANDIVERLKLLKKDFRHILNFQCKEGYLFNLLSEHYPNAEIMIADNSQIHLDSIKHQHKQLLPADLSDIQGFADSLESSFDLITFSLAMHNVNDIVNLLQQIAKMMTPEGLLIANFVGGSSFKNLRSAIAETEFKLGIQQRPHIYPYIHFDHLTPLLQQVGFKTIVTDFENVEFEYNSALAMMQAIKRAGESAGFAAPAHYTITKKMLQLLSDNSAPFIDNVQLISFIASKSRNFLGDFIS